MTVTTYFIRLYYGDDSEIADEDIAISAKSGPDALVAARRLYPEATRVESIREMRDCWKPFRSSP